MRASTPRRGLTGAAGCLILTLWSQSVLAAVPSKGMLEEWDAAELALRQAVWGLYAGSRAHGKDIRGRTVDDDLTAWVMIPADRARLEAARDTAEHQQQAGKTDDAYATWSYAKGILDEQAKRLAVIDLYWSQRTVLERLRGLWLPWVGRAPDDVAKASRARINMLVNQLATDFAPTDGLGALKNEINQLKEAYDEERQKLAALISARQFAAGQSTGSRDRSVPCTQSSAPGQADADKPERTDTVSRPPHLLQTPPAAQFYPRDASRDSISGDVILEVTVGPDGCMKHVEVATSSGAPALDERAMELSEYSTFRPAETAGRRVEAPLEVKYHFKLDDSAAGYLQTGNNALERGDYNQAIADLDHAIELEPGNAMAFADRGMAYLWKGLQVAARADFDKAYDLDPHNFVLFHGRGMLALYAGNATDAIAAFTEALAQKPRDAFALKSRIEAYLAARDVDHAALDNAELIRINPSDVGLYVRQAMFLRALHRPDEALQEGEAVTTANPGNARAALSAAYIYAGSGKTGDTWRALDRSIVLGAGEAAYLTRARYRPRTDLTGRRADIEEALKLNPNSINAAVLLADLKAETGDTAGAITTLSDALADRPDNDTLLTRRAIMYLKQHQGSVAEEDLGKVSGRAQGHASQLNALCWSLATAGTALETALKACNDAVAASPGQPAYSDSLGFVLLKLGRNAEALAAYNHALERRSLYPMSLYGRGIARRRQGDEAGGDADVATASAIDARIADSFADIN